MRTYAVLIDRFPRDNGELCGSLVICRRPLGMDRQRRDSERKCEDCEQPSEEQHGSVSQGKFCSAVACRIAAKRGPSEWYSHANSTGHGIIPQGKFPIKSCSLDAFSFLFHEEGCRTIRISRPPANLLHLEKHLRISTTIVFSNAITTWRTAQTEARDAYMPDPSPARDPVFRDILSPSSYLGETVVPGMHSAAETGTDCTRFLLPPETPDELGWLAHYRILKLLGRGGMGVVFQAEDTHLQRIVALKVVPPEFAANSMARERFLREARACAQLKSDHVVTIYQVGQDRDIPFLAMEFLQGQTLEDRLEGERLPLREVLRIGREIAAGLAAAHERGLIHRDIKPSNIWLESPTGRVKLLDFGLARATGSRSDLTQTGRIVGTPEFMSPEQGRGEELDVRSDLFSLGAVLYALYTGERPFQGPSVMAVLTALAVKTPRPIHELNANVPPPLVTLIECLLEKNPADRLASAEEVRQVLEGIEAEFLSSGDSGSRPRTQIIPPATPTGIVEARQPASRSARRLRIALAGSVLIGAVLLATWLSFRPREGPGVTPDH